MEAQSVLLVGVFTEVFAVINIINVSIWFRTIFLSTYQISITEAAFVGLEDGVCSMCKNFEGCNYFFFYIVF